MNYDPKMYCFNCKAVKPKSSFEFIDRKHLRKVCGDCYIKIRAAQEKARQDPVP